ncbi:MAG: phosphatidate cytidylyltransferase [Flavobacteriales bacterium]|nr:phosphatidate cytidylyltransferase [Flavobacteriales bacterium]
MKNLLVRTLTGAVYAACVLAAAWAGRNATFLLFLPVCMVAADEMHRLLRPDHRGRAASVLLAALAYIALAAYAIYGYWRPYHALAVTAVLLVLAMVAALRRGPAHVARDTGIALMLVVLIALPFATLTHLAAYGPWSLVGFMLILWANDTGAYLAGSAVGRTALMPSVSPGKTVEGAVGGAAAAMAVAWAMGRTDSGHPATAWLVAGAVIVVAGTLGDLLESAWKRAAGVKDSGTLLPGHGGVLDRFDGLMLAAPLHWLVLVLFGAPA